MKSRFTLVVITALISSLAMSGTVFAHGKDADTDQDGLHLGIATNLQVALPQGSGQPIVGGSVTAINSSTLTITNAAGSTFTVNTGSTTILIKGDVGQLSQIAVGDRVLVQGSVSGSTITASSIFDDQAKVKVPPPATTTASTTPPKHPGKGWGRIFGHLHAFFHFFGFF